MTTPLAPQKGTLPVLQYCQPAQLAVDPTYQRELDTGSHQLIRRIAANWDWNLFQPLVVAQREDRSLWVVDGQHRLEAARLRGDVLQLPCVIFQPDAHADEAAVFVELNLARRPLTPLALFKGAIAAGDESAVALDRLLRDVGLRFSGSADWKQLKPGQINIVYPVRRWHARHGDGATRVVLTALERVIRTQGPRGSSLLFSAIGAVVQQYGDKLSSHLFGDVLDRPADQWLTTFHERAARDSVGMQAAAIAVIADAYAEALREVADDEPPVETPAPVPALTPPSRPAMMRPPMIDLGKVPSSMEQRADQWAGRNQ